jgi:hypothetical protein
MDKRGGKYPKREVAKEIKTETHHSPEPFLHTTAEGDMGLFTPFTADQKREMRRRARELNLTGEKAKKRKEAWKDLEFVKKIAEDVERLSVSELMTYKGGKGFMYSGKDTIDGKEVSTFQNEDESLQVFTTAKIQEGIDGKKKDSSITEYEPKSPTPKKMIWDAIRTYAMQNYEDVKRGQVMEFTLRDIASLMYEPKELSNNRKIPAEMRKNICSLGVGVFRPYITDEGEERVTWEHLVNLDIPRGKRFHSLDATYKIKFLENPFAKDTDRFHISLVSSLKDKDIRGGGDIYYNYETEALKYCGEWEGRKKQPVSLETMAKRCGLGQSSIDKSKRLLGFHQKGIKKLKQKSDEGLIEFRGVTLSSRKNIAGEYLTPEEFISSSHISLATLCKNKLGQKLVGKVGITYDIPSYGKEGNKSTTEGKNEGQKGISREDSTLEW